MERLSYNHEVAGALVYLLDASSYVTGDNMLVGGWPMSRSSAEAHPAASDFARDYNCCSIMIEALISSKTRIKLILKFFPNANTRSYLRIWKPSLGRVPMHTRSSTVLSKPAC